MQTYEEEHLAKMRAYAPECTLFLKRNGDFPLKSPGKIAIFGNGARHTIKGGTGSGDVNSRFAVTVERGLEEAGFTVTSKAWLDGYDAVKAEAKAQFIKSIRSQAKKQHTSPALLGMGAVVPEPCYSLPLTGEGSAALYVLARNSGEGKDREPKEGDMLLSQTEIRDISALRKKYQRFMLVLNVGGPVDLSPVAEVENILLLSQLGAVTGQTLADILLGKVNPSGKLAATWSAWGDYAAIGDFGNTDEIRYREGIYVGYRYFDSVGRAPLYPFGFGLSYTEFALGKAEVSLAGTELHVSVPVTNTGAMPGKEVVQVYVSLPWGKLDQPYQTLAGFAKSAQLAPGESQGVTVSFGLESLGSFDTETAAYILEAGKYIVRVGSSSRSTSVAAVLTLSETVTLRQVSHVGGTHDFEDWKPESYSALEVTDAVTTLEISPSAFSALSWPKAASPSEEAKRIAGTLTDEQLATLCVGSFKESKGVASIIGDASGLVAGAAGETSGRIPGVLPLVMADGPAGLRLSRQYTRDDKGVHSVGSTLPAGLEDYLAPAAKLFMKLLTKKPKGTVYEQNCTALPIGTALAQSWNTELCRGCGDIVGAEMERFGVNLWLAPALNIHRNPLCGRNFEYYSEDPLISGMTAAAVTQGVQQHKGCGTTIKHFCCNNQEQSRNTSSSDVSERALREIYLRGFQICVQRAEPCAIMTSYNLLNGTHTSERADLLKTLVRSEWGYHGLIMTDWVIAGVNDNGKYRLAKSAPTIKAGNDVFMPGSAADYKALLEALRGNDPECTLTRKELCDCAEHIVDTVLRLR